MVSIPDIIFYILIFLSVYVQVFFLITFFENRKKIVIRKGEIKLANYPAVTIAVPCWNEEDTVEKTINSLLALNYPKDKIKIFIVDDGSTDNTLNIVNKFSGHPSIQIFRKENGGKYTALNLALQQTKTDFFGGFDADSIAHPEALTRIMSYFEKYPKVMAVAPSVVVHNPGNIIQIAQTAEYSMGVYLKKMLSFLGAINVTPGPLTVFRKKVFDDLGPYRHGHNTEDMEIAYRMQKHHYMIEHCNDAYVYTNTPSSVKKLYKQRLRWIYGFINNTIDYKNIIFKKKYGNFSFFTVPVGIVSIVSISYLFGLIVYRIGNSIYSTIAYLRSSGFRFERPDLSFDPFFLNTEFFVFLMISIYLSVIFAMIFGRRMIEGKWGVSLGMVYFFPLFAAVGPFWLMKAVFNTLLRRKPAWR